MVGRAVPGQDRTAGPRMSRGLQARGQPAAQPRSRYPAASDVRPIPTNAPPETKSDAVLSKNREMLHHYHGPAARDHDLVARLGEIEALTLIVLGTKDGRIGPDSVQLLKREIPRGRI